MHKTIRRLGLDPTPGFTHHRGADDAAEIARMLAFVMERLRAK
jgi:inhibitor of KinA sporulation pathway (predicted exonuclease)